MAQRDPRIDAYIEKSQPFAKPLLEHFRALAHQAIPHAEETLKRGMPHFTTDGAIGCGIHGQFGRVQKRAGLAADRVLRRYMGDEGQHGWVLRCGLDTPLAPARSSARGSRRTAGP